MMKKKIERGVARLFARITIMICDNYPLVSVIIPTYKRAEMLNRAIQSVLDQTYKKIQIIVIDDNDPESKYRQETEFVMNVYKNLPNVLYIKHCQNLNGSAARNTGIRYSDGELLCFLDDDDRYRPQKVEEQVNYLINHPEYDAVYCGWLRNGIEIIPEMDGDLTFEVLAGISHTNTNLIMIKKNVAINCGGWDERFKRLQDPTFYLSYFRCGYKIGVVPQVLVDYDWSDRSNLSESKQHEIDCEFFLTVHENQINICATKNKNAKAIIYSFRYRAILINYIKSKKYSEALKIYLKITRKYPIRFNLELLKYIKKKSK